MQLSEIREGDYIRVTGQVKDEEQAPPWERSTAVHYLSPLTYPVHCHFPVTNGN